MEYTDTKQIADQSLDFPATHTAVVEQIGAVEVTSPSGGSVTVQEILDSVGEESYPTSDALYAAIVGNLDETFIGRKYYDDRGSTSFEAGEDDSTVSF
ncbi:hypothetical protein FK85_14205 [Halorubrum saccharovorum]|uniref:DUF2795 domain-containing protein n=1 Tax=Halorubrum saccharovorum TaxID=2248 RepID=A0A081ESS1_9EURY|nr:MULTISPECIES: hypothetical protein [Halorubrum]KDS90459.1 hypothetical protein FK85_14205 [Halorubrum saccharovorum]